MLIQIQEPGRGWWPGPSAGLRATGLPTACPPPPPDLLEETTRAGWFGNWEFRLTLTLNGNTAQK